MSNKIISRIVVLLLTGMLIYLGYGYVNKSRIINVGDKAYNFKLQSLDGGTLQLSDFKGEMIILNFFASWCDPCKKEAPELAQFARDYGKNYHLIMIDKGETKADVKRFLKNKKYNGPQPYVFDYDLKISKIYGVTGQPETFVIDKNGIVREHFNGPLMETELYNLVKKHDN